MTAQRLTVTVEHIDDKGRIEWAHTETKYFGYVGNPLFIRDDTDAAINAVAQTFSRLLGSMFGWREKEVS